MLGQIRPITTTTPTTIRRSRSSSGVPPQLQHRLPAEPRALGGDAEVGQGDAGALQGLGRVQGDEGGGLCDFGGELRGEEGELGLGELRDVEGCHLFF
jgi:hypothetical protein